MKIALRIGFLLLVMSFSRMAAAGDLAFLSVLDDVPLMTGLSEATEDAVYFDTPKGRIVEAYGVGSVTKESVLSYYKDSLPSLGWKPTTQGTFVRDGEYLAITVNMDNKMTVVRFALSPDGK